MMELIRGLANLLPRHRGCVLTIGNFDGVHLGHQALLRHTLQRSAELGVPSAVMSFDPTPLEYFCPQSAPRRVLSLREKLSLIAASGAERLLLLRFGAGLAEQSPEDFVETLLVGRLGVRAVVVGDDFRFGRQRAGDVEQLRELGQQHGFRVDMESAVEVDGLRCSSTAVRDALARPDLALAARLLGRPYSMLGRVRHGAKLGRRIGAPTANIRLLREPALRHGVYAVRAYSGRQHWDGVANLGVRPTVDGHHCQLEAHLFADTGPLYGRELRVEFCRFLRAEQRFESIEALSAQIRQDVEAAQRYFAEEV